MDDYFSYRRCVELSLIEYIKTNVAADWSNVTVVKSFLQAYKKALPVICVGIVDAENTRREIGSNNLRQQFTLAVDIFATSDGMRLDLADYILNLVKEGFVYYAFSRNSSDRTVLDKDADGRMCVTAITTDSPVDAYPDSPEHDRFRHKIVFICE